MFKFILYEHFSLFVRIFILEFSDEMFSQLLKVRNSIVILMTENKC